MKGWNNERKCEDGKNTGWTDENGMILKLHTDK